jgi:hypothetical protein
MSYCQNVPVPQIFIPKDISMRRRIWFLETKFSTLLTTLKKPDVSCFHYDATKFLSFLEMLMLDDGVRIYLASYSKDGQPYVAPRHAEQITLVFAPVINIVGTNSYVDKGKYYIMNPNELHQEIPKQIANEWIHNFQSFKLPIFTVVSKVSPTDTKSVLFEKHKLQEIVIEMNCQAATGIKINLSSYMDTINEPPEPHGIPPRNHRRTILQFILQETIDGKKCDFYIDDRPGFLSRPGAGGGFPSLDTGSPCPPDVCDGVSLPE